MAHFLGIGILYNNALDSFLELYPKAIDYIEVIPDIWFVDNGVGHKNRFEFKDRYAARLEYLGANWPLVAHHVGFSLGTAGYFDLEYLAHMASMQKRYSFEWNSEHLSYSKVHDSELTEFNTCLALPLPFDEEVIDMLCEKIGRIREAIDTPFLMENNVYFAEIKEEQYKEGDFLKKLSDRSGCGLLLDLHNVHANATNFNFDAKAFVDSIDLSTVGEIHIAGGSEAAGAYLDSHSGRCNKEVWDLLDYVMPRCTNLRGVTFEFHESYFHTMGNEGIREQLDMAREICGKYKNVPVCP